MKLHQVSWQLSILFAINLIAYSCTKTEPFKNPNLPFDKRVDDLVSRMTLDEKISQMMNDAASIPRLGIPEYNWWSEGLHGVANAGIATVFPQAIGLAATFNDSLMYEVATVTSDEFRAKYNDFIKHDDHGRFKGLTVWSPNINIFRDPRWGRGQETYGEDPYLTSRMGVAFVKGMQGNNPKYLKVVSTPKHYIVHSGPEPLRHVFNVEVKENDFMDTYAPAFEACIREAKAYSVMGAYNCVWGKSCCASDTLLHQLLRDKWGFQGYVVSDCDAVADIYMTHKLVKTAEEAAAIAVKDGCDLNCGETFQFLKEAVKKGYITEKEIDIPVKRLMLARMKLGMFDPSDRVPYANIPLSINDNPEHRLLSIEAARQSIVLLKNSNHILPLDKSIKSVAILGPNANIAEVMYGNYNGIPSKYTTPLEGIKRKLAPNTKVYYNRFSNYIDKSPLHEIIGNAYLESDRKKGLKGEYFSNDKLEGNPSFIKYDSTINFNWTDKGPFKKMEGEKHSVRWTGKLIIPQTGKYDLTFTGKDGFRVWINENEIINYWSDIWVNSSSKALELEAGKIYNIKIEYCHHFRGAMAKLEWGKWSKEDTKTIIDSASKCDAILFFGGISPSLEGEENNIKVPGFFKGDRTTLDLPEVQTNILKQLKATGKPVILVLLNGSALALNWEDKNLNAIVEAWYPGQEGGTAIADVLFGDYNPAGHLPVTFYKSVNQLPPFEDYNMKGRTYRYFEGEPLYPFGYGLSYSTFKYIHLQSPTEIKAGDSITINVEVENIGKFDGDELTQLYVKHINASVPVPIHALEGFKRIHLKAGEKKTVSFLLDPRRLSVIDGENRRVVMPGILEIYLGGSQPSDKLLQNNQVLKASLLIKGSDFVIE